MIFVGEFEISRAAECTCLDMSRFFGSKLWQNTSFA